MQTSNTIHFSPHNKYYKCHHHQQKHNKQGHLHCKYLCLLTHVTLEERRCYDLVALGISTLLLYLELLSYTVTCKLCCLVVSVLVLGFTFGNLGGFWTQNMSDTISKMNMDLPVTHTHTIPIPNNKPL